MAQQDDLANTMPSTASASKTVTTALEMRYRDRIGLFWVGITNRLSFRAAAVFGGVASLIGVDAFFALIGAAAIWPVGILVAVGFLVVVYFLREHLNTLRRKLRYRRQLPHT